MAARGGKHKRAKLKDRVRRAKIKPQKRVYYMDSTKQVKYRRGKRGTLKDLSEKQYGRRFKVNPQLFVLIGFMGCGKSAIAKDLAAYFQYRAVDLDQEIVRHARATIPDIFRRGGEGEFRRLERVALARALRPGTVLAAGGGVLKGTSNCQRLARHKAIVIWLDVGWAELWRRLCASDRSSRPLLLDEATGGLRTQAEVRRMWRDRRRLYAAVATLRVRVRRGEKLSETVARVAQRLV